MAEKSSGWTDWMKALAAVIVALTGLIATLGDFIFGSDEGDFGDPYVETGDYDPGIDGYAQEPFDQQGFTEPAYQDTLPDDPLPLDPVQ